MITLRRAAAVAALFLMAPAFASGEPAESLVYQNFVRANEVLDRAIAAHGGAGMVDRLVSFRFSYTGTFVAEGHFAKPWAQRENRLRGTTTYSADMQALKTEGEHEEEKPQPFFVLVGPENGIRLDPGRSQAAAIEAGELDKARREELELLPQEYFRQARAGAAGLRLLPAAKGYELLAYTLENGENRALYLASDTHLLKRVERIDHWTHKGDRLEWRTFSDYAERGGVKIPLRSEVHVEAESTQQNFATELTKFELGVTVLASELSIPEAFRAGAPDWSLAPAKPDEAGKALPTHDLGNGAYIIGLPASDSRALVVAFSDFSVVVEAGDRSELGARLLATVDRLLPGKPVRYVAVSHHHPLYANGIRPYVQRGVTVLATPGNVAYFRELATRPYRIRPDAQQRRPREPKIEVIEGKRVIEDGQQKLELYPFDDSTHVDEFVLAYLPSHKLIVTGDLVYVLRGAEPRPASGRELAIARVVKERGLDVESIMQTWFLADTDDVTPYAALRAKVRLAEAKAAAPKP